MVNPKCAFGGVTFGAAAACAAAATGIANAAAIASAETNVRLCILILQNEKDC
jgi:hypothetical protein